MLTLICRYVERSNTHIPRKAIKKTFLHITRRESLCERCRQNILCNNFWINKLFNKKKEKKTEFVMWQAYLNLLIFEYVRKILVYLMDLLS